MHCMQMDLKIHTESLKYLKNKQLWDLLGDDETLQYTARNNPKFQELQWQKEVLCASNHKLAEQNLSFQPYLKHNKLLLAERYQHLRQLIISVRHKQKKFDRLNGQMNLKATCRLLKKKLAHLKEESEVLGEKFIEGQIMLVEFLESFQSTQKLCHVHIIQMEKLQDVHIQTNRNRRKEVFLSDQMSSGVRNIFYSTSPSIILPSLMIPLMGYSIKPPYLLHLHPYAGADLWMPLMHKNIQEHSQEFKKIWSQTESQIQEKHYNRE